MYDFRQEFKALTADALDKGISVEKEMQAKGFKDFSQFYMSCPKFSLFCWPGALGDLGGGVVLYFHFLGWCMLVLFVGFCIQIPAIMEYVDAGRMLDWNWDPNGFTGGEINRCECIGENNDFLGQWSIGQPMQDDYGTRCDTWDLAWCQGGSAPADAGRWCCRSWCFAKPECSATLDGDSESLSNRYNEEADLTRSYMACDQPPDSQCSSALVANDIAYPFAEFRKDEVVSESWYMVLGPGSFGPYAGESGIIPLLYLSFLAFFCFSVIVKHQFQIRVGSVVDDETTEPRDFAVLVEGLPITATEEDTIKEFFEKHAVKDQERTEVVKVIIGWDSETYRDCTKLKKSLVMRYLRATTAASLPCFGWVLSREKPEEIEQQLGEVSKRLRATAPDVAKRMVTSGCAVVVFRFQTDHRRCLDRWSNWQARHFYKDATCGGFCTGDNLPFFPPLWRIKVSRAPNPSNINWEDLGVTQKVRRNRLIITNLWMGLVLLISFGFVYLFTWLEEYLGSQSSNAALAMLPALGISICNMAVTISAKTFSQREYWNTVADQTASVSEKLAIGYILNTAFVSFVANILPKWWYMNSGLGSLMIQLMGITAIIQPLMFLMDFRYSFIRYWSRRKLDDVMCEQWNNVFLARPTSKEEAQEIMKQRNATKKAVERMKTNFEPSDVDMTKRYAYAIRTFIVSLFFCPLMPVMTLVGIFGLLVQYWVDKYMILRWCKRPAEPVPGEQAMLSLSFVRYVGALGLPAGVVIFLHASLVSTDELLFFFLISMAVAAGFLAVPLSIWRTVICARCFLAKRGFKVKDGDAEDELDYYFAQHLWKEDDLFYHKSHFLYKMVPEKLNPKILTPDSAATSASDLKDGYAAAADVAADDSVKSGKSVAIMGAGKVGHSVGLGDDKADGKAGADAAAAADAVDKGDEEDKDGEEPAADPAADPAKPAWVKKVSWEFETRGGFTRFDGDCQNYIEEKFQEFQKGGGRQRIIVNTQGHSLSVDFRHMTQCVAGGKGGRVRKIKRQEQ